MSNKLKNIPLCELKRSKLNVRKTEPLVDIEQLAASIEVNGVLENLIVRPEDGADVPTYEVIAGGRRFAALKLLAKRKKIVRDHPVPCLVLNGKDVRTLVEVSLAENFIRTPLHPADQFDAFAKLQKEGLPAEDIAARFGISSTLVVQRLKLAAVSPRLMAEYRSGAMTLEQLMAFTICDDHKAQEQIWFENPFMDSSSQAIRRLLTKAHIEGGDRRALFLGALAYEEAGGVIIRDLFQPDDEGYFTDSQLLDRLVAEKLGFEADRVKSEGWAWVTVMPELDYVQLAGFGRIEVVEVTLPKKDEKRLSRLCRKYDELVAEIHDGESSSKLDTIADELDALRARKEVWPEEEKRLAGSIISLTADGKLQITRGLVKKAEREDDSRTAPADRHGGNHEKASSRYSEALLIDLSAHRTAALREMVANQPEQALVALLQGLVSRIFFPGDAQTCIELRPEIVDLQSRSETVAESKAAVAFATRHAKWEERLSSSQELWDRLRELNRDERLELLAYCTAVCIDGVHRTGGGRECHADQVALASGLDMAEWWRPTKAAFFDRLTKEQIVTAVSDGVSRQAAHGLSGRKKAQMAQDAETLLEKTRWLPEPLRTPQG